MCQFQQLYSDESGYVVRCNQCGYYQILFSGTMLSINEQEFKMFLTQISVQKQINKTIDPHAKSVVLPTPRIGVHMVLSLREFDQFDRMLDLSEIEIKALALMDLFYS